MEQGVLTEIGLPAALFVIMVGMGMTLTPRDFHEVLVAPRATLFGLLAQVVALPVIAFGLAWLLSLPPALAVGLVVIAACPGGTTSNLFAYLGRGDVALSIILTVLASLITIISLPLFVELALLRWHDSAMVVELPVTKTVIALFAIVLVPVAIGMVIKRYADAFARRSEAVVSVFGFVVLVVVVAAILASLGERTFELLKAGGFAAALLNIAGLLLGMIGGRVIGLSHRQAFTVAIELGIKNGTLGLLVTLTLLQSSEMSVPAAVYGVMMFFFGMVMIGWARYMGIGVAVRKTVRHEGVENDKEG